MKKLLPFFLLTLAFAAKAQKATVNHVALYVAKLKTSAAFYQNIVGLDTIPEPFHDGRHAWFSIGPKIHLHLIEGATAPLNPPKNQHLCFTVASVEAFVKRLQKEGLAYEDWPGKPQSITIRVDGVKQIYFKDPDGNWIEINDARE